MGLLRYDIVLEHGAVTDMQYEQQVMSDQVIALLVQDNLDIACHAIEKAARERATLEVEEGFVAAFEARRRHREVSKAY